MSESGSREAAAHRKWSTCRRHMCGAVSGRLHVSPMRFPFLRRAGPSKDNIPGEEDYIRRFNVPLKTPIFEYTPSDTLVVIPIIPANGFIQLSPPLDRTPGAELPGDYDHILNGELELFGPMGFTAKCHKIRVGVRYKSRIVFGKDDVEESLLFERVIELEEEVDLVSGSQSLILPCTLPVHDYHPPHIIAAKAFAEVYTRTTQPPAPNPLIRDYYARQDRPSPTEILVKKEGSGEGYEVVYKADVRLRVAHVTENDAGFGTLDTGWNGFMEGLGLYDLQIRSDIWSISAPFHFTAKLPSLDPSTTVFYIRLSIIQSPTFRSVQNPSRPPLEITSKVSLGELGEKPPAGHAHPGKELSALWRGAGEGGKGGSAGGGWEGEIWGRLDNDRFLRPTTMSGIVTPIQVKHALCVEIFFSVYGQYANGKSMTPPGPGELRVMKLQKSVVLPSCANVPNILNLPTYEESFIDQGEGMCACRFSKADVIQRLKVYEEGLRLVEEQRLESERKKRDGQRGVLA